MEGASHSLSGYFPVRKASPGSTRVFSREGEQQTLAMAGALMAAPEVILFDKPSLDFFLLILGSSFN